MKPSASSYEGIAVSGFDSNQLMVFEVAHEAQTKEDEIHDN